MTIRVITLWRDHVTPLTMIVSSPDIPKTDVSKNPLILKNIEFSLDFLYLFTFHFLLSQTTGISKKIAVWDELRH